MTDDVDTADVNTQIDAARAAGDGEKAQALYAQQQGTTDAHGLDPAPVPVGNDVDGEGDAVADSLSAVGPPPDGEWTFARPEVVDHQFALMEAGFGELATDLKSEWGADGGLNLEFAVAASREFEANYPELVSVVDKRGGTNDPLIVELLAVLGREWAATPGDPTTVRLFPNTGGHEQETTMSNTKDIQARIDALGDVILKAKAQNDGWKAQESYQEQLRLEGLLPGGTDPIVGSAGRTA